MNKKRKIRRIYFPISLGVFILSLAVFIATELSHSAADLINSTVSSYFRMAMSYLTGWFGFSLFEVLVFMIPLLLASVIFIAVCRFRSRQGGHFVINFLATVLLFASAYLISMGVGYNTTSLSQKLSFPPAEVTEERLEAAMIHLRDEANSLSEQLRTSSDGCADSGYTLDEISRLLSSEYERIDRDYGILTSFSSRVKGVGFSEGLGYLGLTGIYTFYTGEANVNTLYPDYELIFTCAHELAHQRGIMRENEANFTAYLVLATSDNVFFRYSAALNMYQYVANALYQTDKESYNHIASGLSDVPLADVRATSAVIQRYGETFIADISDFFNDLFLKSNGTQGIVSYGMVVTLALSYLEQQGAI